MTTTDLRLAVLDEAIRICREVSSEWTHRGPQYIGADVCAARLVEFRATLATEIAKDNAYRATLAAEAPAASTAPITKIAPSDDPKTTAQITTILALRKLAAEVPAAPPSEAAEAAASQSFADGARHAFRVAQEVCDRFMAEGGTYDRGYAYALKIEIRKRAYDGGWLDNAPPSEPPACDCTDGTDADEPADRGVDAAREELAFIVSYLGHNDQDANHAWMVRRIRAVLDGKDPSAVEPWSPYDGVRSPRAKKRERDAAERDAAELAALRKVAEAARAWMDGMSPHDGERNVALLRELREALAALDAKKETGP